jgi:hypothetical protein
MDITQIAVAVVAVLGTLIIGLAAVVPTVLEFVARSGREPEGVASSPAPPTALQPRARPDPVANDAAADPVDNHRLAA